MASSCCAASGAIAGDEARVSPCDSAPSSPASAASTSRTERAGWECAFQVEIDPFCRRVLARHWPAVARYGDIRALDLDRLERVDIVCGGFPCQPVSLAGKGLAQRDARWLWPEFARVIRALRPRYILVENVPGLLGRGFGDVVGDLAACGYDAEWDCIPASALGAPHRRDRVWLVAYACGSGRQQESRGPYGDEGAHARGPRYTITSLNVMVKAVNRRLWPTPNVPNGGHSPKGGMSPTGMTPDGKKRQVGLEQAVKWPPPNSRDHKGAPGAGSRERGGRQASLPASLKDSEGSGSLNPTWVEWLMGYPLGWTDCGDSATPSSRKSPNG